MAKKPEPADVPSLDDEIAAEIAAAESTTSPAAGGLTDAEIDTRPPYHPQNLPPPAASAMPFPPDMMAAMAAMMAQAMAPVLQQVLAPAAAAKRAPVGHYHESPEETARRIAEDEAAAAPLPDTRIAVTVHLQPRHHAWLAHYAARHSRTIDGALDLLVRQGWQTDPQRIIDTRPQGPGGTAGSGVRQK